MLCAAFRTVFDACRVFSPRIQFIHEASVVKALLVFRIGFGYFAEKATNVAMSTTISAAVRAD